VFLLNKIFISHWRCASSEGVPSGYSAVLLWAAAYRQRLLAAMQEKNIDLMITVLFT